MTTKEIIRELLLCKNYEIIVRHASAISVYTQHEYSIVNTLSDPDLKTIYLHIEFKK